MGIMVYRATSDQFDDCYGEWKASEEEAIASFWECNTFSDAEKRRVVVYVQKSGVSSAIESIPKVVEGEVGSIDGWTLPTFDGDGRFWVSAQRGGLNARELARVAGVWFVRWPGFDWRRADENYM